MRSSFLKHMQKFEAIQKNFRSDENDPKDHAILSEKSVRKDAKTLFWPQYNYRPIGCQIKRKQNCTEITNNQTIDGIYIVKQQV